MIAIVDITRIDGAQCACTRSLVKKQATRWMQTLKHREVQGRGGLVVPLVMYMGPIVR